MSGSAAIFMMPLISSTTLGSFGIRGAATPTIPFHLFESSGCLKVWFLHYSFTVSPQGNSNKYVSYLMIGPSIFLKRKALFFVSESQICVLITLKRAV